MLVAFFNANSTLPFQPNFHKVETFQFIAAFTLKSFKMPLI